VGSSEEDVEEENSDIKGKEKEMSRVRGAAVL
jgi:hypothetical protein